MIKTIKNLILLLVIAVMVFTPKESYAFGDQHGRDDGRSHHGYDLHFHANPDLTLVSGMDSIDSKVLVDPAPDPEPEEIAQTAPEIITSVPSQVIQPDANGNYIVKVPNNAGGFTPIRIEKYGNGFVGPQGEFYYPFPETTQLKAMYGL